MAENPNTDPQNPGATDPKGAATNPQGGGAANDEITVPEGYELIKSEDKNNIISARDRAIEAAKQGEGSEEFLLELAKEREVKAWYKDNGKDYPDVTEEDLMAASSPEELETIAKKTQQRITAAVEKKLQDVEIVDSRPKLTETERSERVEQLRNSGKPDAFEKMVDLRLKR